MTDYDPNLCAWGRCRQISTILYSGVGLCDAHERAYHALSDRMRDRARAAGRPQPSTQTILGGVVRREAKTLLGIAPQEVPA